MDGASEIALSGRTTVFDGHGAELYDEDARVIARRYKSAHAIQNRLVCAVLSASHAAKPVVLDLGCGTATDAAYILTQIPKCVYVGVDRSHDMAKLARHKLGRMGFADRARILELDFTTAAHNHDLFESMNLGDDSELACVIISLVLHHYTSSLRRWIYTEIRKKLSSNGMLLISDLFTSANPVVASYSFDKEIVDLRRSIARKQQQCATSELTTLCERHYIEENRPSILSDEICILQQSGYAFQDVAFRHGQLAVLVASNP